jgi:hypothetical protein
LPLPYVPLIWGVLTVQGSPPKPIIKDKTPGPDLIIPPPRPHPPPRIPRIRASPVEGNRSPSYFTTDDEEETDDEDDEIPSGGDNIPDNEEADDEDENLDEFTRFVTRMLQFLGLNDTPENEELIISYLNQYSRNTLLNEDGDLDSRTTNIFAWFALRHNIFNDNFERNDLDEPAEGLEEEEWNEWINYNYNSEPFQSPLPHDNMRNMTKSWTEEGFLLNNKEQIIPHLDRSTYAKPNTLCAKLIEEELMKLIKSGKIAPVSKEEVEVSHPIFAVPKNSKNRYDIRMIYDARYLNNFLPTPDFHLPQIPKNLAPAPTSACGFVSDIKSGYHHVKAHKDIQKYLGLSWKGQYFVWKVLPFGLNTAPFIFQKWLESYLRHFSSLPETKKLIHQKLQYLDDIAFISTTMSKNMLLRKMWLQYLEKHNIQHEPSKTTNSSNKFEYLGYVIDFFNKNISLSENRKEQLKKIIFFIISSGRTSVKVAEKICGLFNWSRKGSRVFMGLMKPWYEAIAFAKRNNKKFISLHKNPLPKMCQIMYKDTPLPNNNPYVDIVSDATPIRCAYITPKTIHMFNPPAPYKHKIFNAELYASVMGIYQTIKEFPHHNIRMFCDNMGALYAIKKGHSKNNDVNSLLAKLHRHLERNQIQLDTWYIRSDENPADIYSRKQCSVPPLEMCDDVIRKSRAKDFLSKIFKNRIEPSIK